MSRGILAGSNQPIVSRKELKGLAQATLAHRWVEVKHWRFLWLPFSRELQCFETSDAFLTSNPSVGGDSTCDSYHAPERFCHEKVLCDLVFSVVLNLRGRV